MSMTQTGERHAAQIFGIDSNEEAANRAWNERNAPWQAARTTLLNRATELASRPYQGYSGERVAGLSGNEMMAMDRAARGDSESRQYYDKAGRMIDDVAGSEFNADTQKKYMDPYIKNVVDVALRNEKEAYSQGQNELKGRLATMGAFGGDRGTLLEAQGRGEHLQAVGDITTRGYSQAFSDAFSRWQSDNDRKLRASQAYESVGGDISRLNNDQIANLMQTGGADRVIRQLQNDVMYSAFIERRDWDVTNLQPLLQAVSASGESSPAAMPQSTANAAGETIGAISSIIGYFGSRNGGGGSNYGMSGTGYSSGGAPGGTYYGAGGGSVPNTSGGMLG